MTAFLVLWILSGAPASEDARVLSERCAVTVEKDGRSVTECTVEEVVHTQMAMDAFVDPRFRWRADFQKFTVLEAYSIAPRTGRRMNVPAHAINVVAPFHEEDVPESTPWRETVLSFVGVEPGSRVVRRTRLEDVSARPAPFEAAFPLQRVRPVDFLELKFSGIAHVQLVDPPSGCRVDGAPPSVTVTCRNVPGTGFAGVGSGRKVEILPELYGRLPRVVVSVWKDWDSVREALRQRRLAFEPERTEWPEFLKSEMQAQLTPAGRLNALFRIWDGALRALPLQRVPVGAGTFWKYRAGTQEERALALAAALARFVPEAQDVRVVWAAAHEAAAVRIPNLLEFSVPVVTFRLQGRELAYSPSRGEVGPPGAVIGGVWWMSGDAGPQPMEAQAPLRALSARLRVEKDRISAEGQVLWETFAGVPECARMVPVLLGSVKDCVVEESAPGWRRIRFSTSSPWNPPALELPGAAPSDGGAGVPFDAGVSLVLPAVQTRVALEVAFSPDVRPRVLKNGATRLDMRASQAGFALAETEECRQEMSWNPRSLRIDGRCDLMRRYHHGFRVAPARTVVLPAGAPLPADASVARMLGAREGVYRIVRAPEVWFSLQGMEN